MRVAHKPITTLRQLLTNVKEKNEPRNRQGLFIRSIALTTKPPASERLGRNLTTRLTEHKRATRTDDVYNHIAKCHEPRC